MKNKRNLILLMVAATMLFSLTACSRLSGLISTEEDISPETGQSPSQDAPGDSHPMADAPPQTGPAEHETNQGAPNNGQAGGECENRFVIDGSSNIAQGQEFEQGENFTIQWPVRNVGTCIWDAGYVLTYVQGDFNANATSYPIGQDVQPGETLTLSLDLTAPSQTGAALSLWKLQDADGQLFGMVNPPPMRHCG